MATGLLVAVGIAPAVAQWGPPQTIATGGVPPGFAPRIGLDGQGNPTVVFGSNGGSVVAVTGTSAGTWSAGTPLGTLGTAGRNLALAVSASGTALVAWYDGDGIRTAVRVGTGAWTVPDLGQPGTWEVPGGANSADVEASVDSSGQGVVAWSLLTGMRTQMYVAVQAAGTWPAQPETVPLMGLSSAGALRGDDGSVLIPSNSSTGVMLLRRKPDGTWVAAPGGGGASTIDPGASAGDPAGGTFVAGVYDGSEFVELGGTIASSASDTTVVLRDPASRPSLSSYDSAVGVGLRAGEAAAVWLRDGQTQTLRAVVHEGALGGTPLTLGSADTRGLAAARTAGDDSVVVFSTGSDVFAYVRTPCAGGDWGGQVMLETGLSVLAVGAAAGGNVAVAALVVENGEVHAALFAGTPVPAAGLCTGAVPTCVRALVIPNFGDATATLFDTVRSQVSGTVPVGAGPYGVAVHPVDDAAWITDRTANSLSVIAAGQQSATSIQLGGTPLGIAFDPSGRTLYVASYDDDTLRSIDAAGRTVTGTVPVGSGPVGVAVAPDGKSVFTANYAAGTVSRVDVTTTPPTVATSRLVLPRPLGIAVDPAGARVYVTGFGSRRLAVLDATTAKVLKRIRVGRRPTGVAVEPGTGAHVYVANAASASVSVIDAHTGKAVGRIPTGKLPYGVSIDPANRFLFVVESGRKHDTGNLLVWDIPRQQVAGRYPLGRRPVGLGDFVLRKATCH